MLSPTSLYDQALAAVRKQPFQESVEDRRAIYTFTEMFRALSDTQRERFAHTLERARLGNKHDAGNFADEDERTRGENAELVMKKQGRIETVLRALSRGEPIPEDLRAPAEANIRFMKEAFDVGPVENAIRNRLHEAGHSPQR